MINKILNLAKLQESSQESRVWQFNASLPLLLKVLEKTRTGYLLQIGNRTLEAKSMQNLTLGAKYWANIRESSIGEILLSNLTNQPKIFDLAKNVSANININDLAKMLQDSTQKSTMSELFLTKDVILENLNATQNPNDFLFLANSLIALKSGISSMIIKDNKRRILLQVKRNGVIAEFCAVFENLGVINGSLYAADSSQILQLKVQFESVKKLLEKNALTLGFERVEIVFERNIGVMFELCEEALLDLKA